MADLNIAVVCASNLNRSMEAHAYLSKKGYKVKSFGTADMVRLPGTAPRSPVCYQFGTSYEDIYNDLSKQNAEFYTKNGVMNMLNRNLKVKARPERFQESEECFGIIITCDNHVYNQVIKWFNSRQPVNNQPVHVANIDIKDSFAGASLGAFLIRDMVNIISQNKDNIDVLLQALEAKWKKGIRNCVMFY